ncbi:MAG: UDP-N-acetylglucosamine 4-epimerase [Bacteroidetes bacterium]|jgi:UDP-glucose 4-epimerase|nr:UDP-N-acetylglucosamine 4-epimerase [Bacteroidota bacterium]
MKKVLMTGVSGFIGSNLLDFLIKNTNWHITGYDNLSTGNKENISEHLNNKRFTFCEADAFTISTLRDYDVVFHLAALPRIQPSFELISEHITANVLLAAHLLEVMIREQHYPKLIYSGSSAVYGTPEKIPTPESEKIDCLSPYAFQKYEVERYLELIATRYPIDYVTLRYFNPYGPRSFNEKNAFNAYSSVVGIFLNKAKKGEPMLVTGDGSQQRDFIHVEDIASANYQAAIHPQKLNTFFNIGQGATLSVLDLAKKIGGPYNFIPKREGEAEITFADNSKARTILNWEPKGNLSEYLKHELQK